MIQIFQSSVWLTTFLTCIFISLCIWFFAQATIGESNSYTNLSNIALTIIRILFGSIPPFTPRTYLIRWIIFLWFIFCMNWNSAYTSSLISMITTPIRTNMVFFFDKNENKNHSVHKYYRIQRIIIILYRFKLSMIY